MSKLHKFTAHYSCGGGTVFVDLSKIEVVLQADAVTSVIQVNGKQFQVCENADEILKLLE